MASIINASTSGVGGVITTADNSGILNLQTAGTTAITVDASQNVGIGVTPSAWSANMRAVEAGAWTALVGSTAASSGYTRLMNSSYYNGTNFIYKGTGTSYVPAQYVMTSSGAHEWHTAPSGTAGNAITFTQAMTLDASGQLAIGRATAASMLDIEKGGATTNATSGILTLRTSTSGTAAAGLGSYINFLTENSNGTQYETAYIGAASSNNGATLKDGYIFFSTALSTTNPAERMRIDASGNVGIGVTPSTWTSQTALQVGGGSTGASLSSGTNGVILASNLIYNSGWKYLANGYILYYQQSGGAHYWGNAPSGTAGNVATVTDRMVLDASGNLIVGKTVATTGENIQGLLGLADGRIGATSDSPSWFSRTTSNGDVIRFNRGSSTAVGSISVTTTTTSYVTSSDYRLKENVVPMTGALDTVSALKPVTYNWKADGSDGQGFIAHELAEVVPDCVTGEKDATKEEEYEISPAIPAVLDEEGNEVTPVVEAVMGTRTVPVYQGIDTSFLVATLVAAIQELKAEIDLLKGVK
jgi:hypothetical protein